MFSAVVSSPPRFCLCDALMCYFLCIFRVSERCLAHLELVISVFGRFVEGSVVAEAPDVVDPVEALDAIGDSVHLEDADAVRHRRDRIDLQV